MLLRITLLSFVFIFMGLESKAQGEGYIMILRKNPKGKRFQYNVSDPIMFRYHDTIYLDTITGIDADRFQLRSSEWYGLSDVKIVYDIKGRSFFKNGAVKFPVAGLLFLSLTTINQALSHGKPLILREHLIPAVALVAVGALMLPFRYPSYRLNGRWQLITIPN